MSTRSIVRALFVVGSGIAGAIAFSSVSGQAASATPYLQPAPPGGCTGNGGTVQCAGDISTPGTGRPGRPVSYPLCMWISSEIVSSPGLWAPVMRNDWNVDLDETDSDLPGVILYWYGCRNEPGAAFSFMWTGRYAVPGSPTVAPPPRVIAEFAFDAIDFPTALPTNRNPDNGTVNLESVVWLDAAAVTPPPVSVSLQLFPGFTASAAATPVQTAFLPGTGVGSDTDTCAGLGQPYVGGASDSALCSFRYQRSSANRVNGVYIGSVRVTYRITYGAAAAGVAPESITLQDSFGYAVDEVQAINQYGS